MAGVELKISVKEIKRIDSRLADRFGHALAVALALNVEREGKRNTPKKTGNLQRSIRSRIPPGAEGGAVIAGGDEGLKTPVIYAAIQEWGGVIRPKNGKYLRFEIKNSQTHTLSGRRRKGSSGGKWVSVKQVTIKGKHYMQRAVQTTQGRVMIIATGVFKELKK